MRERKREKESERKERKENKERKEMKDNDMSVTSILTDRKGDTRCFYEHSVSHDYFLTT